MFSFRLAIIIKYAPATGSNAEIPGQLVFSEKAKQEININITPITARGLRRDSYIFMGYKNANPPINISHARVGRA